MCSLNNGSGRSSGTLAAYKTPEGQYLYIPVSQEMPGVEDTSLPVDEWLEKAFPDEAEREVVRIFLAVAVQAGHRRGEEVLWCAVNWWVIDREIGPWRRSRGWMGLKGLLWYLSFGRIVLFRTGQTGNWFFFPRFLAERRISQAVRRLIAQGVLRQGYDRVCGKLVHLFHPESALVHRLNAVAGEYPANS